jgi:hypothetical protein
MKSAREISNRKRAEMRRLALTGDGVGDLVQ